MLAVASKRCRKCGDEKTLDAFHRQASGINGRRGTCRDCRRQDEKWGAQALRERNLRLRYGLTPEQYADLGSMCHACGATDGLCVDHCHSTQVVRGLLCRNCNVALGLVGDDADRLRALATYLEERVS